MFAAVHPVYFDERFAALDMRKKEDAQLAVKGWVQVRKMEHWRLLFAAAEEANYALLKESICLQETRRKNPPPRCLPRCRSPLLRARSALHKVGQEVRDRRVLRGVVRKSLNEAYELIR